MEIPKRNPRRLVYYAKCIAIYEVMKTYRMKTAIAFVNNAVEDRMRYMAKLMRWVIDKHPSQHTDYVLNVAYINSKQPPKDRQEIMDQLKDRKEPLLVWNHKCLSEGVDLPYLDGIIFFDPKTSPVSIIQALGRVMRKPENTEKTAYVIIPILYEEHEEKRFQHYQYIVDTVMQYAMQYDPNLQLTFMGQKKTPSKKDTHTRRHTNHQEETIKPDAQERIYDTYHKYLELHTQKQQEVNTSSPHRLISLTACKKSIINYHAA